MELPGITLVTPSLNQGRYLEATLRSVLDQAYPALDYRVMDGGSQDGSTDILRKYGEHLGYWESAPDKGQADAIFRGFEEGSGEVLGWLNSDDLLLPGALRRVGEWFGQNPDCECVVGASLLIDEAGDVRRDARGHVVFNPGLEMGFRHLLLVGCWGFNQPAVFWRRRAFFESGGFDRALQFAFDYDLFLRLARRRPICRMPVFLASFREHSASKTSTMDAVRERETREVRRRFGFVEPLSRRDRWEASYRAWRARMTYRVMKFRLLTGLATLPGGIAFLQ